MANKGWSGLEPYDVWLERKKRKSVRKSGKRPAPPSKALNRASSDAHKKRLPGSYGTGKRKTSA
jgi:hypothetical protein